MTTNLVVAEGGGLVVALPDRAGRSVVLHVRPLSDRIRSLLFRIRDRLEYEQLRNSLAPQDQPTAPPLSTER